MDGGLLEAGFVDPVFGAQSSFRAIMDALANPGTRQSSVLPRPAPPLPAGLAAVLLTLADPDMPVWFAADLRQAEGLDEWLAFHTAAPFSDEPRTAQFAIAGGAKQLAPLADYGLGSDTYPDRSTTIALAVPSLDGGPVLLLRGPGIESERRIAPAGLPEDFIAQWALNRAMFPRGVDLLLICGAEVLGLPRTTRITLGD